MAGGKTELVCCPLRLTAMQRHVIPIRVEVECFIGYLPHLEEWLMR